MRLNEFYKGYFEYRAKIGNCKKTLTEHYRFIMGPVNKAVGNKEIKDLRLVDRADLMEAGRPYGEYGSQRAVVTFRQLCHYITMLGMRLPFDWRDVETPRVPDPIADYLTPEELERVRNAFDLSTHAGLRTRCLIEFLLDTGLRISEATGVNIEDLDYNNHQLKVRNCKTGEEQIVYFTDRSIEWIERYLESRHDDIPALFVSGRGRLLSVTSRNYIRSVTKGLGINKRLCHHIFRRTNGTYLLQNGVDIKSVQTLLRHKSERTTLRHYIGVSQEKCKDKHQQVMSMV